MMTRIRAQFDGKVLVPIDPVDLPQGRVLEIDVRDDVATSRGSARSILEAMSRPPHIPAGEGEALLRAIDEGRIPVQYDDVFDIDKK